MITLKKDECGRQFKNMTRKDRDVERWINPLFRVDK